MTSEFGRRGATTTVAARRYRTDKHIKTNRQAYFGFPLRSTFVVSVTKRPISAIEIIQRVLGQRKVAARF